MPTKHTVISKAFIGLDVHKNPVSVAIALDDGSDPIHYGNGVDPTFAPNADSSNS